MLESRRSLLVALAGAAGCAVIRPQGYFAQSPIGNRPHEPPPAEPPPHRRGTKAVLEEEQKELKKNVARLYELASELKAEVDKTDATSILSINLLKKAEAIEKLARQIKTHAKGE